MGYLQIPSAALADFSKGVISVWFRVPAATLAAARVQFDAAVAVAPNTDYNLAGIIPLVTFGPSSETYTIYDGGGSGTSTGPISPCVIGIATGNNSPDSSYQNVLYFRAQYSTGATVAPSSTVYNDFFQVGSQEIPSQVWGGESGGSFISVTADAWHHVLISFDFSGGCSSSFSSPDLIIDSTCPFFWAFDDVDYNGAYLWPNTPLIVGQPNIANGIFSDLCIQLSGSFSFAAGNIPTNGKPIGIPSSSGNSAKIYNVEMAELQFFTGVTLDTSVDANRRLFVDATGHPVDPAVAAAGLGQVADVLLHGGDNFKAGINTGNLTDFSSTGTINLYSPGP